MKAEDVQIILAGMGHKQISDDELFAVLFTTALGEKYGFGNLIAWLNTAWVIHETEKGHLPMEEGVFENGGHGNSYPFPQTLIEKYGGKK